MCKSNANKVGVYLDKDVLDEMKREAVRQDRPVSWIVQHAWRRGKKGVAALAPAPGLDSYGECG